MCAFVIDFSLIHERRTVVWKNLKITGVCLKVFRSKYGLFLELLGTCYIHNARMYTITMSILYFSGPKNEGTSETLLNYYAESGLS
jgi:hypothetical protein